MGEVMMQSNIMAVDKVGNIVLDIENLKQPSDKCVYGTKSLARKGSYRMDKRSAEEQEVDEPSKKLFIKVLPSQLEQLKLPLVPNKALIAVPSTLNSPIPTDSGDGRGKRFQRLTTIHPRKILLFFATMSSIGTMTLIYFTLAINRRGGV